MTQKLSSDRHSVTLRCDRRKLIAFYDQKPEELDPRESDVSSPISAITGLIGEDLVFGALRHYFLHAEQESVPPPIRCKQPGRTGYWLDGWIITKSALYQTEVKNWCASAFGGRSVEKSSLVEVARYNLRRYLSGGAAPTSVWKVLADMGTPPEPNRRIKPLLAFWSPVAKPSGKLTPFFECSLEPYLETIAGTRINTRFKKVSIFSASLYLRTLKEDFVELEMGRAARRLRKIEEMLSGWRTR